MSRTEDSKFSVIADFHLILVHKVKGESCPKRDAKTDKLIHGIIVQYRKNATVFVRSEEGIKAMIQIDFLVSPVLQFRILPVNLRKLGNLTGKSVRRIFRLCKARGKKRLFVLLLRTR